eukprot:SAG11_NODE_52039_length_108_cov_6.333333_1_plen_26_part_10
MEAGGIYINLATLMSVAAVLSNRPAA